MPTEAIVRVFTAHVSALEWEALRPVLAGHVARHAETWRAVFAHWVGSAPAGAGIDLAVVTGFEDSTRLASMTTSTAAAQTRQGLLGDVIARGRAEDYRLVDQFASSFAPAAASVMRLVELTVSDADLPGVLSRAGLAREAPYASGDLAVTQTLRRDAPDGAKLLFVSLFRDAAAVARWPAAAALDAAEASRRARSLRQSTYRLEPVSALRLAPDGPAILITADDGRVVDATPAAIALLGRSVWNVLGVGLSDLGVASNGLARVDRPEGGAILLRAHSLRDLPAPGRHATLLLAGSAPAPSEADAADALRIAYRWGPPDDSPAVEAQRLPG